MIQTFDAGNALYPMVQAHDYEQLYRTQIREREMFRYPPFHRLICVQLRHHDLRRVEEAAGLLQQRLALIFGDRVSGVVVPSIARVQAYHIRHIMLRVEQRASLTGAKQRLIQAIDDIMQGAAQSVQVLIDVDPM